jgi:hypothetical protein
MKTYLLRLNPTKEQIEMYRVLPKAEREMSTRDAKFKRDRGIPFRGQHRRYKMDFEEFLNESSLNESEKQTYNKLSFVREYISLIRKTLREIDWTAATANEKDDIVDSLEGLKKILVNVNEAKTDKPEPSKILCRTCAAYGSCKLEKKGTAVKCRNFWEHRPTDDFVK